MKLSEIPKEELEMMSYDDIAYYILQESGKKMKLNDIFKKVCKTLELPDDYLESHIMDFFELMSTNKKFVMLDSGYWDLQSRHALDIVLDDELDDEEYEENPVEEEETEENQDDIFYDQDDETDDTEEDDLSDLVIIDGDEEEQNL